MNLDPSIFEKAADLIEKKGWWVGVDSPLYPHLRDRIGGHCPVTAVTEMLDNTVVDHIRALCKQAGVITISQFYVLNDNQPDYETGKTWAINLLRETAKNIRKDR